MDALKQIFEMVSLHHELSPFLVMSILVLAGVFGGWVAKWVRLPHITGNILGGVLVGPACLGLIGTHEQLHDLQPLSTFAMSLVAVSIGGHLSYRRIHNSLRRIISISLFEVGCTFFSVMLVCRLFGMDWPTTCLLAAIGTSTAPASTIALVREMRAKGPFVKTLISVVALNNIFCILLFVMMKTFVAAFFESGETVSQIDEALLLSAYHLLGALGVGAATGAISGRLVKAPKFHDFSTILVAIMVCDGLAAYFKLSPLLVNLFFGVYLANSPKHAEKQLTTLVPLEPILYICFFTLAGVSLHLDQLVAVGGLAVVYLGGRMLGKSIGASIGGVLGRCNPRIWKNMSFALFPQSGIAIGLVVLLNTEGGVPEELRSAIGAIVLAGVALSEVVGPFCTKAALARSAEAGKDRQRLVEFLAEEFILVDLKAKDKADAIHQMVEFLMKTHRVEHMTHEELFCTVMEREELISTAMGKGVAIPHGHVKTGPEIQGVMAICRDGIDFDAPDGNPVKLMVLVVTPTDHKHMHIKVLSSLAAMVSDEAIRTRLIAALNPEDAMEVIESEEMRDYNYFLE